jgi:redox-sensitive bicupin YhaK (pirin superfamily)
MSAGPILKISKLGFPWQTQDPFLFCVYHLDAYPAGNAALGPQASLQGRNIGQDFAGKDGWRMYHGESVPGFPAHPHRGFETVTIVRQGYVDHSDSLGATARFGPGDVQWLTAGQGIVHCEMFPLLESTRDNPLELFQIWLNLPASEKMCAPHFSMLWHRTIPKFSASDAQGRRTELVLVAGQYEQANAPPPPPHSWAARMNADVCILTLKMEPHAQISLPPAASPQTQRTLYFFRGNDIVIANQTIACNHAIAVRAQSEMTIVNGDQESEILVLGGRPIGEPVVAHGPFVMNTKAEIQQAFADYQRTQFGGWPWPSQDPVHPRNRGRFAKHVDGNVEESGED